MHPLGRLSSCMQLRSQHVGQLFDVSAVGAFVQAFGLPAFKANGVGRGGSKANELEPIQNVRTTQG